MYYSDQMVNTKNGRSERIRTSDPIVPNKARRRVALKSLLIFVSIEPNVRPLFTRSGSHPVPRLDQHSVSTFTASLAEHIQRVTALAEGRLPQP